LKSKTFQRDAFVGHEGDSYFQRNAKVLAKSSPIRSLVVERIAYHAAATDVTCILEIGCASGTNLAALHGLQAMKGYGIDPSHEAIQSGKHAFPFLDLRAGTADGLPYDDAQMDVVWFGFCLYLMDRPLLHRVITEADRVLKDGGMIAIFDFDPDAPCVRPYRHSEGVDTFKMDYSAMFTCDPAYVLVEKLSFSHEESRWAADPQERIGLWICRKSVAAGYARK
jgi:SAM-dependent methyltransferase